MTGPVKALTLAQPWATLVAVGAKRVETRGWPTRYRGLVAIHAARGMPRAARDLCAREPFRAAVARAGCDSPAALPRGAVVALCQLVACDRITPANVPDGDELAYGDYTPGRFAWRLADVRALDPPVPARGALGLWTWEAGA